MKLKSIDVGKLDCFSNGYDIRYDLYCFMQYVREREVKRSHRENSLAKSDLKRIIKLFKNSSKLILEFERNGEVPWVNFVDSLARKMGLVDYDVAGIYAGYTSREPTFPDNYIIIDEKRYSDFLQRSSAHQDEFIRNVLINSFSNSYNEFFCSRALSRLDSFDSRGCATGINQTIDFATVRRQLFNFLQKLQPGIWYSTASFIAMVEESDPFIIVPKRYYDNKKRYKNYVEHASSDSSPWGRKKIEIDPSAQDAFARVEGRYIERFLEGIPLEMNYIDVAYAASSDKAVDIYPTRGHLQAFRLNEVLFTQVNQGDFAKVVVNPNFEIHIQAPCFPLAIYHQLISFCDVLQIDRSIVLKLNRAKTLQSITENSSFNPITTLEKLSGTALPSNVRMELEGQLSSADTVVCFENYSLLEALNVDKLKMEGRIVEKINGNLAIVSAAKNLYCQLVSEKMVPALQTHGEDNFTLLGSEVQTLFPQKAKRQDVVSAKEQKRVVIKKEEFVNLVFDNAKVVAAFEAEALKKGHAVMRNGQKNALLYSKIIAPEMNRLIKSFQEKSSQQVYDL